MKNIFIVAVDGHAGCGKSSICSQTCKKMNWVYISTGALYRGLGYLAHQNKIDTENQEELNILLDDFSKHISWDEKSQSLYYKTKDLGPYLLSEEVGFQASRLATKDLVRDKLLPLQRDLINSFQQKTVLVEGRDIGTVVCPDAPLKIFMTASIEVRALRRLKQLEQVLVKNKKTLPELKQEISKRDHNDSTRKLAPLLKSDDAISFDTSGLSFDLCVEELSKVILAHQNKE